MSVSAYYQRAASERSRRAVEDEWLLGQVEAIHEANYHAYGYRRTWLALKRPGIEVGRNRVKRLMRANGVQAPSATASPGRTTKPDATATRPPDLVDRDFTAEGPDRLWVADFTYVRCWEGTVYFSFVIDVWSRPILGWRSPPTCAATSSSTRSGWPSGGAGQAPTSGSCTTPMPAARESAQYTSHDFAQVLDDHGVLASIGSVGDAYDCDDGAIVESGLTHALD